MTNSTSHGEQDTRVSEILDGLVRRSTTDPSFRQLLLEDGRRGVEEYADVCLPEDYSIRFIENRGAATIVLPSFTPTEELSEEHLTAVAGGVPPLIVATIYAAGAIGGLLVAIDKARDGK